MMDDMRLLVVEDDSKIASFVVNGLKQSDMPWTIALMARKASHAHKRCPTTQR